MKNYSEFFVRSTKDWEKFTPGMVAALDTEQGLPAADRWEPRHRAACVACARLHWSEELKSVCLAGRRCFMRNPRAVCKLLSCERYEERWPLIPKEELRASSVELPHGSDGASMRVLLHKRRVSVAQALGEEPVLMCSDCYEAFEPSSPWLCKYALANDLWLGRWDPLFRRANLSHQMLLALARVVLTKVSGAKKSFFKDYY